MRPNKARFITACQQILALGAVIAVLAPAANVVSLDVVPTRPGDQALPAPRTGADAPVALPGGEGQPVGDDTAVDQGDGDQSAEVATAPVDPVVREVALAASPRSGSTKPDQGATEEPSAQPEGDQAPHAHDSGSARTTTAAPTEILSDVEDVTGYGAVGVTWEHGEELGHDDVSVQVRTRTDGTWTTWSPVDYHDEHGADEEEGDDTRPGTDALLVGEVDQVQAKVRFAPGVAVPDDLKLAVISPGTGTTDVEKPAIDTATMEEGAENAGMGDGEEVVDSSSGKLALQAGSFTAKPKIYSRAQWGANENMRDKGSLRYYEVHAGFVHHTVNANNYTRAQVPGIIRSIYAYHTQSRGWSDVGYNFLVDRFGRIWEGRYGGVDRPVVGAHTLGYNDYSFAMSAIGNYETAQPSAALIDAYARLMAWKLSLHGVDAASTSQRVGSRTFKAINGHRDAGSTACPGRYLYAKIPTIRSKAAQYQADWRGRSLATDVVSSAYPDILLRRASDKAGFALPTQGMLRWKAATTVSTGWSRYDAIVATPDVNGDGKSDLIVRDRKTQTVTIRPGNGAGGFGASVKPVRLSGFDQFAAVGDLNGRGGNDFVARNPKNGRLYVYRGTGSGTFSPNLVSTGWKSYNLTVGAGDVNGDGHADLYSRDTSGRLWFHAGTGSGKVKAPVRLGGSWQGFNVVTGIGDFNGDGIGDLYVRNARTNYAFVYPGRGDGRLGHRLGPFGRVGSKTRVSAANVTGTKDPDVVALSGDTLTVIAHNGTQNVSRVVRVTSSGFANANALLNVGDWNRDGHGDFIARNASTKKLELFRGQGGNKFAAPVSIGIGWGSVQLLAAVGDTTGDGFPDLMGQPAGKAMRIYPGSGNWFKASFVARGSISANRQVGIGRWDRDGAPDNLFRVGDRIVKYTGNGPGGLTGSPVTIKSVSLAPYDWVISAGDIDRNGRPDLVLRKKSDGTLWLLPGGATSFGTPKFLAEGFGGYDLAG